MKGRRLKDTYDWFKKELHNPWKAKIKIHSNILKIHFCGPFRKLPIFAKLFVSYDESENRETAEKYEKKELRKDIF